jgi:pimeloyl-ACP methyl ester carboxylesterase
MRVRSPRATRRHALLAVLLVAAPFANALRPAALQAQRAATPVRSRVSAPAPAAGTMLLHAEPIALQRGGLMMAERGIIVVPVNRRAPARGVLTLEVYRFRATRPQVGAPPIFLLYGGPNFLGLEPLLAQKGYYEQRLRALHATADLVVVSQRGIGPSKPTTLIEGPRPFPLSHAVTAAEEAAAYRDAAVRAKAAWTQQGLDLTGFTVLEAAADLNDVRRAMGYDRIVLWGGSFGSHWAMATMRRYPSIVARAVLRGMEGPDHTYDMPSDVLGAVRRIAAEADTASALRGMIPPGGLMAALDSVLARVSAHPVMVTVTGAKSGRTDTVRIGVEDVREAAMGYTKTASSRDGMRSWAADIITMYRGDFTGLAQSRVAKRDTETFRTASYFMLDCGSGITAARSAQIAADPAVRVLGPLGVDYRESCPSWNIDLGDAFRQNFTSAIPMVISQGDYDVSTPMENARELAPFFTNSTLVIVHGGSHPALDDAMDALPAYAEAILTFARTGSKAGLPSSVQLPAIRWVVPPSR